MELAEWRWPTEGSAAFKYAFLDRVMRCTRARGVKLMGFSVTNRAVLLLEGSDDAVASALYSIKAGTARASGCPGYQSGTKRYAVYDPLRALVEVHRHGVPTGACPLTHPWSSHRDLLGFRQARFFDPGVWTGRIDPRRVHVEARGAAMPRRLTPSLRLPQRDLDLCLRVSAAVLGVLPASRHCRRLFVHLGRRVGQRQVDVAGALLLTPRRVRQLQAQPEPLLPVAIRALADWRLRCVP